jgi:hypothetical protein
MIFKEYKLTVQNVSLYISLRPPFMSTLLEPIKFLSTLFPKATKRCSINYMFKYKKP